MSNSMYAHQIDQLSRKELVEYVHEINRQFDEYRAEQEQRIAELKRERNFLRDFWIKRLEPYKSRDEMKILLMIEAEQLRKEQNND